MVHWKLLIFLLSPIPILVLLRFVKLSNIQKWWNSSISFIKRTDNRLFNGKLSYTSQQIIRWSVPVIYAVLFIKLTHMFYVESFPKIINPHTYLYNFLLSSLFVSFMVCIFKKPSILTKASSSLSSNNNHGPSFKYDHLIFFPSECSTCHIDKPARSKHCKTCDHCVELFDHHCIWLNNCIGMGNFQWFYTFLLLNVLVMGYGSIILIGLVCVRWGELNELELKGHGFGELYESDDDDWTKWDVLLEDCFNEFLLLFLLFSFGMLLLWFTYENCKLIYVGMTTNEMAKWDVIQDLVEYGNLYKDDKGAFYEFLPDEMLFVSVDQKNNKVQHVKKEELILIESMDEIDNIYDLGTFWNNLKDRIYWI